MVYVKSAENQDCRTADSPQRVFKHVLGFAKPGTSSYNISTYWKATKYCNGHQKSGSQQSYRKRFGHSTSASCFLLWYRVPNVYLYPYNGKIIYEWILRIYVGKLVP